MLLLLLLAFLLALHAGLAVGCVAIELERSGGQRAGRDRRAGRAGGARLLVLRLAHHFFVLGSILTLLARELVKDAALADGEEFVVRALLDDDALLHNGDHVGVADRGKSVCDGDRREGGALHDRRGGLVEQQDGGLLDDGACNGDALLLAARELAAAQPDLGVETIAKVLCDEVERVRRSRRRFDLLARGTRLAERDIFRYRPEEEHRLLCDEADLCAERLDVVLLQVDAVEQDGTRERVVVALEQLDDGRFARARRADERARGTCWDGEAVALADVELGR
eukprot:scaffold23608_cov24-Tisochrysis_lutea.AAC.3